MITFNVEFSEEIQVVNEYIELGLLFFATMMIIFLFLSLLIMPAFRMLQKWCQSKVTPERKSAGKRKNSLLKKSSVKKVKLGLS